MDDPRGEWVKEARQGAAVVFVHGVLSDGKTCWRYDDAAYWPDLLAAEASLGDTGIYVFSYRTGFASGSYSIGDAVEALYSYLQLDGLLHLRRLVFVCHSMGGIVVRQFLVTRQAMLIDRGLDVGLFLVASPSLGSGYANLLSGIIKVFGHSQGLALRFAEDNSWLNDLDRNFMNLRSAGYLKIAGQELVEDVFVALSGLIRKPVVEVMSGQRYFGDAIKIPGSDHFSIAKPKDREALQHRLLVRFIEDLLAEPAGSGASASRPDAPDTARIRVRRLLPEPESEWRSFDARHLTLGRGPNNDLVVDDPKVSWEHGMLAIEQGVFVYKHLSRTNPSDVSGRGRAARLEDGGIVQLALAGQDRITIGAVTFAVDWNGGFEGNYVPTVKEVPDEGSP